MKMLKSIQGYQPCCSSFNGLDQVLRKVPHTRFERLDTFPYQPDAKRRCQHARWREDAVPRKFAAVEVRIFMLARSLNTRHLRYIRDRIGLLERLVRRCRRTCDFAVILKWFRCFKFFQLRSHRMITRELPDEADRRAALHYLQSPGAPAD